MSRSKRNRKKSTAKRGRNGKPKSVCNGNKQPDSTDNKNKKKRSADDIAVEKRKLMCRRYEEFHEQFLHYDKIVQFLQKTKTCNPNSVELVKIGNSGQGRPIYMVSLTTNLSCSPDPKMAAFIEAGLNGENSIAVSNTLYMIEYLTKNTNFLKIMDYYIVPCSNPDAYEEFINSKENGSKKSSCSLVKKKAKTDLSENDEKKKDKSGSDSDISDDNSGSKNGHCNSKSENKPSAKKPPPDSTASNENHLKNSDSRKDNEENTKDSTKCKLTNKNGQQKDNCNKTPKQNETNTNNKNDRQRPSTTAQSKGSIRMDLSLNFPVVLGVNDMARIPTASFLEKIKKWKENFKTQTPETEAILKVINRYQFAIKLFISLQEGGEAICYPYGFCAGTSLETDSLKEAAKKGKSAITGRNFEYGSIFDIQGLTYGHLIDFLKVDKSAIKYMYVIKVHKKTPRYNETGELRQLMRYGCEIMECVKRISCAVYKDCTDMSVKHPRRVETQYKRNLDLDLQNPFEK